jgi:Ca2+/Na+ antiporter
MRGKSNPLREIYFFLLHTMIWGFIVWFFNIKDVQIVVMWTFAYAVIIVLMISAVKIVRNAKEEKEET